MKNIICKLSKYLAFCCALLLCFTYVFYACELSYKSKKFCANANSVATQAKVIGYLPNWSYEAYKTIDFSALTHINIAFCNVDANGEFYSGIPDGEMYALVSKAHEHGVKIMAALGGGGYGDPYRALIANTEKINSLNAKLEAFCVKYSLDGIDLDIELASSDSIWNSYGEWVASLRTICNKHDWVLSTATAQWVAGNVTAETFALFDFVNVMAYDNDGWNTSSHSSYDFAVECLNYFNTQKNIPKENLILGVPFYGRGYNSSGTLDWNSYLSFSDLVNTDVNNYYGDVYNGVAYNGANTIRQKCILAKGYGGIMIWEITLDAKNEYSLLSVIKEELLPPQQNDLTTNNSFSIEDYIIYAVIGASAIILLCLVLVIVAKNIKNKKRKKN